MRTRTVTPMAAPLKLENLPNEILIDQISMSLAPKDFVSLCQTSKQFYSLLTTPIYWRNATAATFRLPEHPLLKADGERSMWLYKTLATQSKAYTWGSGSRGSLGHSWVRSVYNSHASPQDCAVPKEMEKASTKGIIVDLQCGGWSTTFLNSSGALYSVGVLDGLVNARNKPPIADPQLIRFPSTYPPATQHPDTTIAQFSSGRTHVLGLSDSGKIWQWNNFFAHAVEVELQVDLNQLPRVKKVVAGWSRGSAYLPGRGIAIWTPTAPMDTTVPTFVNANFISSTWYQRPKRNKRDLNDEAAKLGRDVGEVVNHVVLDSYVVFLTDIGKVFSAEFGDLRPEQKLSGRIVELTKFRAPESAKPMTHIEGSFRNFAVFNGEGLVFRGTCDHLRSVYDDRQDDGNENIISTNDQEPDIPAGLQHRNIVSLAFGDWHWHALTADGQIMSFGRQPQSTGCFGLGDTSSGGDLRGVRRIQNQWDSFLVESAQECGKKIWFEPEKLYWLSRVRNGEFVHDRQAFNNWEERMWTDEEFQTQVSAEMDRLGDIWDATWRYEKDGNEGNELASRACVALSVAAAGWHSGALVLANDEAIQWQAEKHNQFMEQVMSMKIPPSICRLPFLEEEAIVQQSGQDAAQPERENGDNGGEITLSPTRGAGYGRRRGRGHGPVQRPRPEPEMEVTGPIIDPQLQETLMSRPDVHGGLSQGQSVSDDGPASSAPPRTGGPLMLGGGAFIQANGGANGGSL